MQPLRAPRLISVLAMLVGALTGGVLLRWVALAAPLWLAAVLLACATGAYLAARWRSSLSLECERHHGKVPVAEPLIDYLLPFVS
jgi:hypothetical protein